MPLILREEKGSKLTIQEMDGNLIYLDNKVPYKVYTALLTQAGSASQVILPHGDPLTIGVTYLISFNDGSGDFTNVGAPNNNTGTLFVATGVTPTSWGDFFNV